MLTKGSLMHKCPASQWIYTAFCSKERGIQHLALFIQIGACSTSAARAPDSVQKCGTKGLFSDEP